MKLALWGVSGASCNAYVSVCLVDAGNELTGEVKQTKSKTRTNAPVWNEEFTLGTSPEWRVCPSHTMDPSHDI